jgi:hypothetical protein
MDEQEKFETVAQASDLDLSEHTDNPPISWSAAEYIVAEKNAFWYVGFAFVVLALIVLDIFLLKSYIFTALVILMAISLIVYIRRPARQVAYSISPDKGIYVAENLRHFEDFKYFGVIKDGEHFSIMLIPTKRFAQGLSIYFPEELGEKIVDVLGSQLPMQELKLDAIDKVIRKLHL